MLKFIRLCTMLPPRPRGARPQPHRPRALARIGRVHPPDPRPHRPHALALARIACAPSPASPARLPSLASPARLRPPVLHTNITGMQGALDRGPMSGPHRSLLKLPAHLVSCIKSQGVRQTRIGRWGWHTVVPVPNIGQPQATALIRSTVLHILHVPGAAVRRATLL